MKFPSISSSSFLKKNSSFKKNFENLEKNVRNLIACEDYDLFFSTSCHDLTTNLFLATYLNSSLDQGKNQFLVLSTEENYFLQSLEKLQHYGIFYDWISVNESGLASEKTIVQAVTPKTLLLAISLADGLTGIIHPLDYIKKLSLERDFLLYVNLSHALQGSYFNLTEINPDFFSFYSLSFENETSLGCIGIRKDHTRKMQLFFNYYCSFFNFHSQENLLHNFNLESERILKNKDAFSIKTTQIRSFFEKKIKETIPKTQILFHDADRLSHISVVAFEDVPTETLSFLLFKSNIFSSIGYGRFQPLSQILQAIGIPPFLCHSALSIFFSEKTKKTCVENLIEHLYSYVKILRSISQPSIAI